MLAATCCFGQTYTNGVFVKDGKTVEVGKQVLQFTPTNAPEVFHFSNELIAKIHTNSDFTINNFGQEVYDVNATPRKARFGSGNLAATLMNGTATMVYSGTNDNSSCVISTPMADIELHKGVFYFRVDGNKVLIFVLEGSMTAHSDKKENTVTAGYALIAVPNDIGILEAKISIGAEKAKQTIIDKLLSDSQDVIKRQGSILFAVVNGKVLGVLLD